MGTKHKNVQNILTRFSVMNKRSSSIVNRVISGFHNVNVLKTLAQKTLFKNCSWNFLLISWMSINFLKMFQMLYFVSEHSENVKGHLLCPFLYMSQVSPECVCEVSAQNNPQINYIISFWKCLFWVEAETRCFHACLFKCKWAALPAPFSRTAHISDLCQKHLFGFDNHVQYLTKVSTPLTFQQSI